jgi:hypothetical protein
VQPLSLEPEDTVPTVTRYAGMDRHKLHFARTARRDSAGKVGALPVAKCGSSPLPPHTVARWPNGTRRGILVLYRDLARAVAESIKPSPAGLA